MIEKLGSKNLPVCENQSKQHKLRVMKKKQGGKDEKETKDLLNKKKKVMQLVKPINC